MVRHGSSRRLCRCFRRHLSSSSRRRLVVVVIPSSSSFSSSLSSSSIQSLGECAVSIRVVIVGISHRRWNQLVTMAYPYFRQQLFPSRSSSEAGISLPNRDHRASRPVWRFFMASTARSAVGGFAGDPKSPCLCGTSCASSSSQGEKRARERCGRTSGARLTRHV